MDLAGAAVIALSILFGLAPLGIFALTVCLGRRRGRRQEPSHVSGTEPTGDPTLRAALKAARDAARQEHIAWDTEFMLAQGAPLPSAGDPYDLVFDLNRLAEWHAAQHKDLPDCTCLICNVARRQFYSKGGHTSWN